MTGPLVSVLMPVRNGDRYLSAALESILTQTGCDFEAIVVDDGSTDGTPALLAACSDPRLRVASSDGQGVGAAIRVAASLARGQFLARMDADDLALPGRLARQAAVLARRRDAALVHCSARLIDGSGRVIGSHPARQLDRTAQRAVLLLERDGLPIIHPGVMIRRSMLEQAGGYRPLPAAQDHELWLRLIEQGPFLAMPEELLLYRRHPGALSANRLVEQGLITLTNCVAARFRHKWRIDLFADDPSGYAALDALIAERALPWVRRAAAARTVRSALREGRLRQAGQTMADLIGQGAPQLVFTSLARREHVSLQHALLQAFEQTRGLAE